jgi:hypothetical protein
MRTRRNAKKLRDAGLVPNAAVPEQYKEMIDQLSPEELEALLALKRRVDAAGEPVEPLTVAEEGDDPMTTTPSFSKKLMAPF